MMCRAIVPSSGTSIIRHTCPTAHCHDVSSITNFMFDLWLLPLTLHRSRLCKESENRLSSFLATIHTGSRLISFSRKAFKNPVEAMDCENLEEVLLRPYALLFPGDNPMQAEMASSAGLGSNHFCRTCKVGGTREFKQSDEGFQTLFKVRDFIYVLYLYC